MGHFLEKGKGEEVLKHFLILALVIDLLILFLYPSLSLLLSLFPYPSLFLTLYFSFFLSLSICLSLSVPLFLSDCHSLFLALCLSLSLLSISLYPYIFISLSLSSLAHLTSFFHSFSHSCSAFNLRLVSCLSSGPLSPFRWQRPFPDLVLLLDTCSIICSPNHLTGGASYNCFALCCVCIVLCLYCVAQCCIV